MSVDRYTLNEQLKHVVGWMDAWMDSWMDGWMDMDGWMVILHPFQQYFQSYQDDSRMIMKASVQWNPVYG